MFHTSTTITTSQLGQSLARLQVPCPWGDLKKHEGMTVYPGMPELNQTPFTPIGLVLGAGTTPSPSAYTQMGMTEKFGKLIFSDRLSEESGIGQMLKNYVRLDLTNPNTLHLGGLRVHALMSICVFTYDGLGVNFFDTQNEQDSAHALNDLLFPGGIWSAENLAENRFERLLMKLFGYQIIRNDFGTLYLQKPF